MGHKRTAFIPSPITYHCSNGWGGRIRTYECRIQRPVPYHLATPQCQLFNLYNVLEGSGARAERRQISVACERGAGKHAPLAFLLQRLKRTLLRFPFVKDSKDA